MNRLTPLILAFALFMENMDATVIATSLAAIAADIGTEPIALKLAMTAYLVALAIFIPISSWMADRFGAKNVFRIAVVVFMVGSLACAFSDSLLTFVLSRFLQGMGGALMTPVARLVLVQTTPKNQFLGAMAWLTIPAMLGPIAGPPIGGFLTTFLGWQWIFFINIPIGLVGLVLVTRFLPEFRRDRPRAMDFFGFLLVGVACAGVVFGFSVLSLPALPMWVGGVTIIAGLLAGVIYVGHARRAANPLLDLTLLRLPLFRAIMISGAFFRLGVGAIPLLLPLMLQLVFGLTPFESGMVTFTAAVGALSAKFVAEWIFDRIGFKNSLMIAAALTAALILVFALFDEGTPQALIIAVLVFSGFFQSTFWTGSSAFTFADIEDKDAGQANVISLVWIQVNLAMGVALGGGVLELSQMMRGGEAVGLADFHVAFLVVGAVCALSAVLLIGVPRGAAAQLARRGRSRSEPPEVAVSGD